MLRETVKLLHPVMPFITEELWDKLGHRAEHGMLIGQPWPAPAATDAAADAEMGWLVTLISDIRSARSELNVPAGAKLELLVVGANDTTRRRGSRRIVPRSSGWPRDRGHRAAATAAPKAALQIVVGEATYALPVGEVIDLKAEGARLQKEIKKLGDEIAQDRRQARQCELRGARAGRGGRGAARAPRPGRADARAPQRRAEAAGCVDRFGRFRRFWQSRPLFDGRRRERVVIAPA